MPLLSIACALLALHSGGDAPVYWGEKELKAGALPEEMPPGARAAVGAWREWCAAHEYRLDLDHAGRILLVSRRSNDNAPKQLALALSVVERFDQELPAPAVRREVAPLTVAAKPKEPPKPARGDKPLPEDPEDPDGGDHPWKLAPPKPEPQTSAPPVEEKWGSQGQPLDTQTMVLFIVTDQDDFEALLAKLAEAFPFLAGWVKGAEALAGFVLGDPLTAAYLENPAGVEEWNPDHELINRLARLCVLRRFAELPNWFVQGYAWHMEIALRKAVYCFPWRDEFVWASEHTGWPGLVKNQFKSESLKPSDFLGWKRGKYLDSAAKASFGAIEFLLAKHRAELPDMLDHLRVHREEHGRTQDDPTRWRRDTEYEIPLAEQQKILVEHLGAQYLDHATIFLRQEIDK